MAGSKKKAQLKPKQNSGGDTKGENQNSDQRIVNGVPFICKTCKMGIVQDEVYRAHTKQCEKAAKIKQEKKDKAAAKKKLERSKGKSKGNKEGKKKGKKAESYQKKTDEKKKEERKRGIKPPR